MPAPRYHNTWPQEPSIQFSVRAIDRATVQTLLPASQTLPLFRCRFSTSSGNPQPPPTTRTLNPDPADELLSPTQKTPNHISSTPTPPTPRLRHNRGTRGPPPRLRPPPPAPPTPPMLTKGRSQPPSHRSSATFNATPDFVFRRHPQPTQHAVGPNNQPPLPLPPPSPPPTQ